MRHDYSTEQFQTFRQEVRESFWGQVRWRTQPDVALFFGGWPIFALSAKVGLFPSGATVCQPAYLGEKSGLCRLLNSRHGSTILRRQDSRSILYFLEPI